LRKAGAATARRGLGQGQHQRLAQAGPAIRSVPDGRAQQAQVDLARIQRLQLRAGDHLAQRQVQAGAARAVA
jgi:hypothetical protein